MQRPRRRLTASEASKHGSEWRDLTRRFTSSLHRPREHQVSHKFDVGDPQTDICRALIVTRSLRRSATGSQKGSRPVLSTERDDEGPPTTSPQGLHVTSCRVASTTSSPIQAFAGWVGLLDGRRIVKGFREPVEVVQEMFGHTSPTITRSSHAVTLLGMVPKLSQRCRRHCPIDRRVTRTVARRRDPRCSDDHGGYRSLERRWRVQRAFAEGEARQ